MKLEEYFNLLDEAICPYCHNPVVEEGENWYCRTCTTGEEIGGFTVPISGHISIRRLHFILSPEEFKSRYGDYIFTTNNQEDWLDIVDINKLVKE